METVLRLSLTSSSVDWVLLEGQDADAAMLDHDHFTMHANAAIDGEISTLAAAVRGAQSIAAASGHDVRSIAVTWSDDVAAEAALLLKSLPDMGFERVVAAPLPDALPTAIGDHPIVPAPARPLANGAKRPRARFGSHARAAVVLFAGVTALFALGPEFAGQPQAALPQGGADRTSATAELAASDSSTTSVSVHAVPSAPVAPVLVRQIAEPAIAEPDPAPTAEQAGSPVNPQPEAAPPAPAPLANPDPLVVPLSPILVGLP